MTGQKINKNSNRAEGFTIVEVGLVLALGALIFLSVFLVVPAFQRNARDNARKDDVAAVANAVSKFYANDPSNILSNANDLRKYLNDFSSDSSLSVRSSGSSNTCATTATGLMHGGQLDYDQILVCSGYRCKTDGVTQVNGSADDSKAMIEESGERSAAVLVRLESGDANQDRTDGKAQGYCQSVGEN